MNTPRGIRNRNPGNIEFNALNQWQGQLEPDLEIEARFVRFDSPENGIRALAKLLLNYRSKSGLPGVGGPKVDTVFEIISRWAPSAENDTNAYAKSVARALGVEPHQEISLCELQTLRALVVAIIRHENGKNPYCEHIISEGVRRALE